MKSAPLIKETHKASYFLLYSQNCYEVHSFIPAVKLLSHQLSDALDVRGLGEHIDRADPF